MNVLMAIDELRRFPRRIFVKAQLMVYRAPDRLATRQAAISSDDSPADRTLRQTAVGEGARQIKVKPATDGASGERPHRLLPTGRKDHRTCGRDDAAPGQIEDAGVGTGTQSVIVSVE